MTGAPCGHSVEGSWHYLINLISPSLINSISASSHSPLGPPICPPSSPRHSGICERACRLCDCTHTINIRPSCPFLRNLLLPLFSPFRVQPLSILTHTHGRPEASTATPTPCQIIASGLRTVPGHSAEDTDTLGAWSSVVLPTIRSFWCNITIHTRVVTGSISLLSLCRAVVGPSGFHCLSLSLLQICHFGTCMSPWPPVVTNQLNPDTSARLSPLTCGHRMHTNIPASTHTTAHEHRLQP